MKDMWAALEEHTRAWHDLDRQGLADAVWATYVTARYSRTGDVRALKFLYPYLNHSLRTTRLHAIEVAARVFHGSGPNAIGCLDYFTRNTDLFLRDRAVQVVGAAVAGWPAHVVLETFAPYLSHRNHFVRRQAVTALSRAAVGSADAGVLAEIVRVTAAVRLDSDELALAVARVFAGNPTEKAYELVVRPDARHNWRGADLAVGILLRNAEDEWYERGLREFFEPRLHADPDSGPWPAEDRLRRWPQFVHRAAIEGLCRAAPGKGVKALERVLHLRHNACTLHSLMAEAPKCFADAGVAANRDTLLKHLREGDVPTQRIGAQCLGRLLEGSEDEEATALLTNLTRARNRSVAAAAVAALGRTARSACDESLRGVCLELAAEGETATAGINALGMIFQGSGRADVLADLRDCAEAYRHRPERGRKHCRPLAGCYHAVGLVYQGTGSMEPVDFLLDALAPMPVTCCAYRSRAGHALVMIEFPKKTVARAFQDDWI